MMEWKKLDDVSFGSKSHASEAMVQHAGRSSGSTTLLGGLRAPYIRKGAP